MTDERWDVIDADGRRLGRTTRRAAPQFAPGEFHAVVGTAVIAGDGRLLVTRRAPGKSWAGRWEFPAGSALAGETSVDAARRELFEETGIDAPRADFVLLGTVLQRVQRFDVYAVRVVGEPSVVMQDGEVDDFAWVEAASVLDRPRGVDVADPWHERLDAVGDALRAMLAP